MSVENDVKKLIQQEYKSLKAFSEKIGLPYTTVDSIFKRGFSNSSVSNMIKISNELNLDVEELNNGIIKKKGGDDLQTQKNTQEALEIIESLPKDLQEYALEQLKSLKKLDKKNQ